MSGNQKIGFAHLTSTVTPQLAKFKVGVDEGSVSIKVLDQSYSVRAFLCVVGDKPDKMNANMICKRK